MPKSKVGLSEKGKPMHYSVGALIEKDGKFLLIDRNIPPYGWAPVAGHWDEGEPLEKSLYREVEEEVKLNVKDHRLIFEGEMEGNKCSQGFDTHYWYIFACKASGEVKINPGEVKGFDWYTLDKIRELYKQSKLEEVWETLFRRIEIL